jgi:pescadillo protein
MSTFLEFYATLLKFTNYKLYSSLSLQYPPALQLESESGVYNSYKAFLLKAKAEDKGDI